MGIWESEEFIEYCKTCKRDTDHKIYNYNEDKGDESVCMECEI